MKSSRLKIFFLATLGIFLALCVLLNAGYTYVNPSLTDFYAPPNPLPPGAPGEIIRTEKIETNNAQVQAWRVMYHSRDLRGDDIAVTGIFAAPIVASSDGVPLLAIAHGTNGLGQQCAPSLDRWNLPTVLAPAFSFPDEVVVPFVQAGYAVAATDYQGLGAPGDSSFLVGKIEAQNILDSMRALRNFRTVKLNDQNFVWGHSQGGHSAAFAAQLANQIAPEIKLRGIALAAPAADLQKLVETVLTPDQPSMVTGVAAMVAASWYQTYDLPLETVLTKQGVEKIPPLLNECVLTALVPFAFDKPSAYYFADPTKTSPWAETMRLNIAQAMKYPAPVFVAQGNADAVIAPQATEAFVKQLCEAGNAVEFRLYPNASHSQVVPASLTDVLAWFAARSKNKSAPSDCAPSPSTLTFMFEHTILSDGDFTPEKATIAALEKELPNFLAQQQNKFSAQKPPIAERLAEYKFQYWGEMQNEKRVIVVNAFCANFEDWKTQRVFVLDGGDCFFNLQYDIDSGTFLNLQVNGEA